ncbi:MAG TPA: hypothetical protein VF070_05390 [Streptosporangiaceae bacterium]
MPLFRRILFQNPQARGYSFVTMDVLRGLGHHELASNGAVYSFGVPGYGSLTGKLPAGQAVTGIAATPGGGYLVLTSNGGVHNFGAP